MLIYLHNKQTFSTFAGADRLVLQPNRQGYSDSPSAFIYLSDNILNRNKMNKLKFEELPEVNSDRWLSTDDLQGEIWKDIPFCSEYKISNYGRFKSLGRYIKQGDRYVYIRERIMRSCKTKNGYLMHSFRCNGRSMTSTVHLLVWNTFCGTPPVGYEVNHIDENKYNNTLDNLNILTHKDNVNWGTHNERMAKTLSERLYKARKIAQYKDGVLVAKYESIVECERLTGINHRPISACCSGKRRIHKGFTWKYLS